MKREKMPIAVSGTTVATADLYFCRALRTLTTNEIIEKIRRFVFSKKLTIKGTHQIIWIENGAVCITIVLEESHIIFTTYPEGSEGFFVQLDVVLCNYKRDNFDLTRALFEGVIEIFNPMRVGYMSVTRRGPDPQIIASAQDEYNSQWQEMSSKWLCQTTEPPIKRRFP